jgi:hypothetical protein
MPEHGTAEIGFDRWARGHGVIRHTAATQARVRAMVARLSAGESRGDGVEPWDDLHALDRVATTAMWLVVHETYAQRVCLDGRPLATPDFKPRPGGHTGGALNMSWPTRAISRPTRSREPRGRGSWGRGVAWPRSTR